MGAHGRERWKLWVPSINLKKCFSPNFRVGPSRHLKNWIFLEDKGHMSWVQQRIWEASTQSTWRWLLYSAQPGRLRPGSRRPVARGKAVRVCSKSQSSQHPRWKCQVFLQQHKGRVLFTFCETRENIWQEKENKDCVKTELFEEEAELSRRQPQCCGVTCGNCVLTVWAAGLALGPGHAQKW